VAFLREGFQGGNRGAVNPQAAHELVSRAPGGIEALIRFRLDPHQTQDDLLRFAWLVVTRYLATASLDDAHRESLVQLVFGVIQGDTRPSGDGLLAAMEWLWILGGHGSVVSTSQWVGVLLDTATPLLEAGDLRVMRALARLQVAPATVAAATIGVLRRDSCEQLQRSAYLLGDPDLLHVLRTSAGSTEDALIERVESCHIPAATFVGVVLRVARRDPWSDLRARLESLAIDPRLPAADFIACVREATAYDPGEGMRSLPAILRMRPQLRIVDVSELLHPSLTWVRSVDQMIDLIQSGSLYWDTETRNLRSVE